MAAIYLYMSERQLEDLRFSGNGPQIEKTIQKDAQRQNQPVRYATGDFRRWCRARTASSTFDAAVKAGLAGWVMERRPFFAEREEAFNGKRCDVLVGGAWDQPEDEREACFAKLFHGQLRVVWMVSMEAASALWASASSHRLHADRALALLREEAFDESKVPKAAAVFKEPKMGVIRIYVNDAGRAEIERLASDAGLTGIECGTPQAF